MKDTIRKSARGVLSGALALVLCATVYSYWVETIETQWEAELVYPVEVIITGLPVPDPVEGALGTVEIEENAVPVGAAPEEAGEPGEGHVTDGEPAEAADEAEPAPPSEPAELTEDTDGEAPTQTEPEEQPQQDEPAISTEPNGESAEEVPEDAPEDAAEAESHGSESPDTQAPDTEDPDSGPTI